MGALIILTKYWQAITATIATGMLAWFLHAADVTWIEAKHQRALEAQAESLRAECAADKKLTMEVSRDYQTKIASLNVKLAAAKRVRSSCIVPAPKPAPGRDAAACGGQPAGTHGITTDALYEFAAESESYRLRLISCQRFIADVWAAKGQ